MVIHLDVASRQRSCDLPIHHADYTGLFDLAPGGVYLATHVPIGTGGLLHHHFTIALSAKLNRAVCFLLHLPFSVNTETLLFRGALSCGVRTFLPHLLLVEATISPISIIHSSAPSQKSITLQLGHVIISTLFLISMRV